MISIKDLKEKLKEKRLQEENEMHLFLEDLTVNNISDKFEETISTQARLQMIDDIIFLLEYGVWEENIPMYITKQ